MIARRHMGELAGELRINAVPIAAGRNLLQGSKASQHER
jgi:hypothetical protein